MIRFAAKRSALVVLMLVGLLAITFTISHVAPADPAALAAGPDATHEMIERYRVEHGLDRPLPEQFAIYLRDLVTGDWGRSIHTTRPVWDDLVTYFPNTFELVVFSIAFAIVLGVPLGVLAAVRQNRPVDHVIRVITVSGVAMPMFWLGLMAQLFFALQLGWFPLGGRIEMMTDPPEPITHLLLVDTLPARRARDVRRRAPPHRAAGGRALVSGPRLHHPGEPGGDAGDPEAGLHRERPGPGADDPAHRRHLRVAQRDAAHHGDESGCGSAWMLGGTVLVEAVFDWPGIGLYAVQAAISSDFEPIMGATIVLGFFFMMTNFLIDVVYGLLDPRVRHQV